MRVALAWVLIVFGWHQSAYGWGDEGHRITGHIANALLLDETKQQLRALLGTDDLSTIATWMDDEREALNQRLPNSSRWHYENRAVCDQPDNAARICPRGQCITRQIERSKSVLRNPQAPKEQRAEAVRVLVHLLGDLHQPLHLIDNHDRGGNDTYVLLPREKNPRRLHEVWDTRLVRMNLRRIDAASYARSLTGRFQNQHSAWQSGTIEQWAGETYALGKQYAYQALPAFACSTSDARGDTQRLPTAYIETAKTVVDSQLATAGVRIAWVLNQLLS